MDFNAILTALFLAFFLVPVVARRWLELRRLRALGAIERARGTRVIAMIHRQETIGSSAFPSFASSTSRTPRRFSGRSG